MGDGCHSSGCWSLSSIETLTDLTTIVPARRIIGTGNIPSNRTEMNLDIFFSFTTLMYECWKKNGYFFKIIISIIFLRKIWLAQVFLSHLSLRHGAALEVFLAMIGARTALHQVLNFEFLTKPLPQVMTIHKI